MIERFRPRTVLLIAFGLMLLGFVLPVLMIMQILESTFFLNFLSYTASLLGLILGLIGVSMIVKRSRRK